MKKIRINKEFVNKVIRNCRIYGNFNFEAEVQEPSYAVVCCGALKKGSWNPIKIRITLFDGCVTYLHTTGSIPRNLWYKEMSFEEFAKRFYFVEKGESFSVKFYK